MNNQLKYWLFGALIGLVALPVYGQTQDDKERKLSQKFPALFSKENKLQSSSSDFKQFDGLTIQQIYIQVIEPANIGLDTAKAELSKGQNMLNKLSIKTPERLVRKDLLFSVGDKVNPLTMAESEQLLRQSRNFRDARVKVVQTDSQTANIYVVVKDKLSWQPLGNITNRGVQGGFKFNNLFGYNHDLKLQLGINFNRNNLFTYIGDYRYRNIAGSHINFNAGFRVDKLRHKYDVKFQRNYYSINAKWAGKVQAKWNKKIDKSLIDSTTVQSITYDGFISKSLNPNFLGSKSSHLRVFLSARTKYTFYKRRPSDEIYNPSNGHIDRRFFLGSIGLMNFKRYKERDVFRLSKPDYLPQGFNIAFSGGLHWSERHEYRGFIGSKVMLGKAIPSLGYHLTRFSVGSYIKNRDDFEQTYYRFEHQFISKKVKLNKWGFRQFIYNEYYNSFDNPLGEGVSIDNEKDINGFKIDKFGARKYNLNLESTFYTPKSKIFRASMYVFADYTLIGAEGQSTLLKSRLYQGYGFGARIDIKKIGLRNIEMSLAYYPNINGEQDPFNFIYKGRNNKLIKGNRVYVPSL